MVIVIAQIHPIELKKFHVYLDKKYNLVISNKKRKN